MKESQLEGRLVRGIRAMGGKAYKFVSPGNVGVPDRIVILPGGRILFAELKADGGRLSAGQLMQIKELRRLGAEVYEVWGASGVDSFLGMCREKIQAREAAQ
ncbi:VRR-NUC domain-containing protein [Oscillospiraceae bacterium OttesenSCG-928-G22]|nr:VRR-NUC domain-containing protein [Oscillospiraceae bacterium OttesenSCG-928-G22]